MAVAASAVCAETVLFLSPSTLLCWLHSSEFCGCAFHISQVGGPSLGHWSPLCSPRHFSANSRSVHRGPTDGLFVQWPLRVIQGHFMTRWAVSGTERLRLGECLSPLSGIPAAGMRPVGYKGWAPQML